MRRPSAARGRREDLAMKFRGGELRLIFRRQHMSVKIDDHRLRYLPDGYSAGPSGDAMCGSKTNVPPDGNKAGLATIRIKITLMRDLVQPLQPVSD